MDQTKTKKKYFQSQKYLQVVLIPKSDQKQNINNDASNFECSIYSDGKRQDRASKQTTIRITNIGSKERETAN